MTLTHILYMGLCILKYIDSITLNYETTTDIFLTMSVAVFPASRVTYNALIGSLDASLFAEIKMFQ